MTLFRATSFPIFFVEAIVKSDVFSFDEFKTDLNWFEIPETEDSPRKSTAMFRTNSGRGVYWMMFRPKNKNEAIFKEIVLCELQFFKNSQLRKIWVCFFLVTCF